MPVSENHRRLLSAEGMELARNALLNRFDWFFHTTPVGAIETIRTSGLEPRDPGARPDPVVTEMLGPGGDRILCVRPRGSTVLALGKEGFLCQLAVEASDLPNRVGLDWSFPNNWHLLDIYMKEYPEQGIGAIFAEIARATGSVASYDLIPPTTLRIGPARLIDPDPGSWPKLIDFHTIEEIKAACS
ncbi:hypothetical protein [Microvirga tunisiensis]|uniref:DUF4433 domain-containing protein n=1 Tax=Microvirga tunisiensis TaxID=2108360 RepID=A0A5N7MMD8_9HYPH|nr:hypothetical protein [Microvirga tunisiensis]MPR09861.1 hypothetical protein [Microvirga tunisiensis]MPR28053.1 hypothetical protein [Microvirga tunisiensis]